VGAREREVDAAPTALNRTERERMRGWWGGGLACAN
jgi:hypothetical protein